MSDAQICARCGGSGPHMRLGDYDCCLWAAVKRIDALEAIHNAVEHVPHANACASRTFWPERLDCNCYRSRLVAALRPKPEKETP